jgi:lambda family phage tail tape measure protein
MADLSYTVDVNTTPAQRNLQTLQNRVVALQNKFSGLASVIAGLAVGAAIRNVINYADALQDLSDSTSIAVSDLIEFQKAVELSGGSAEAAQTAVTKLTLSINEAADGSAKVLTSFKEVGVTFRDIQTLSEQDILAKTIQGLAKIEDSGKRASLATDLLGKSARSLNFKGVADELGRTTAESIRAAESFKKLADFQDKLDRSTQKLRESLANTLGPLIDKINEIPQDKLNSLIDSFVKIGLALTALVVALPILEKILIAIQKIGVAIGLLVTSAVIGFGQLSGAFSSAGKTIGIAYGYVERFIRGVGMFNKANGPIKNMLTLFEKLALRIPYMAGALGLLIGGLGRILIPVYLVIEAVNLLDKAWAKFSSDGIGMAGALEKAITDRFPRIAAAINKLGEALGMAPPPSAVAAAEKEHNNEMARIQNRANALKLVAEQQKKQNEELKRGAELQQRIAFGVSKEKLDSKQRLEILGEDLRNMSFKIFQEEQMVRLTEDQREIQRAVLALDEQRVSKISDMRRELEQLKLQQTGLKDGDVERNAILAARIKILEDEMIATDQLFSRFENGLADQIRSLQSARMIEQARLQDNENIVRAIEAQIDRQQQLGQLLQSANDKLKDTQFAGAQARRSPLEQQMAAIQEDARKAALEAGRAFAASYEGMDLTAEQAQELANGLQLIADKYKAIAEEQLSQLEYSRSWEAGWKDAFDRYMENATNAATRAGEVFGSITRNMESAIDRFVETGKFSFKDFARSIIQDLLKIELKAQASKLFGMIAGPGGGLFSALGKIFGFANGGVPPLNKPSIVGEKGPEIFVPKQTGTIIPNHNVQGAMNAMGAGAVSAPVTNNYITNNISAVDAKSVAQLFAENRKTLLGTVEMARKELPYATR